MLERMASGRRKRIKDGKLEGERKKCRVRVSKIKRNIRVTFDDKTRTVLLESSLRSQSNSQSLTVSTGWSRTLGSPMPWPPECCVCHTFLSLFSQWGFLYFLISVQYVVVLAQILKDLSNCPVYTMKIIVNNRFYLGVLIGVFAKRGVDV